MIDVGNFSASFSGNFHLHYEIYFFSKEDNGKLLRLSKKSHFLRLKTLQLLRIF